MNGNYGLPGCCGRLDLQITAKITKEPLGTFSSQEPSLISFKVRCLETIIQTKESLSISVSFFVRKDINMSVCSSIYNEI